jgi:serine-type D-Ala-D-Ala endopeptidase (penicillin-binding protein 7)
MSDTLKHILYWVAIFIFIFGCFKASKIDAQAAELDLRLVTIDQATLHKGYTVRSVDDRFWLPIMPDQFNRPITVKLEKIDDAFALPINKKAISAYYNYEVQTGADGFLPAPVLLSLKYYSDSSNAKSIYYFDKDQNRWRELVSTIDSANHLIRTRTVFPAAQIVVLENYAVDGLTAISALVVDENGAIIYEKNPDEVRPLASVTKLMTAAVFLDNNPGWEKQIAITADDAVGGSSLSFQVGDKVKVKDLFYATLTGSKNNAAHALARATGLTEDAFVAKMNDKATSLGLEKTTFVEPTGLSNLNVSTAREIVKLSQTLFELPEIKQATTVKWYKIVYQTKTGVYKQVWVQNTNKLLTKDITILAGKTGYTEEAGSNLISQAQKNNHQVTVIVLGCDKDQNYDEVYLLMKKYL